MAERRHSVLLVGQGPTAASALEALLARFHVVGLVRAPLLEGTDPVIAAAERNGVLALGDTSLPAVWEAVRVLAPDCVVVSSYDRILPAELLGLCPFVNVHYAPLPAYRGRANVNWAIINGEPDTAITVHVLTASLDGGGILFQQRVPIGDDETVTDLYERLNELQRVHLAAAVESHLDGDRGTPQDESAATYGCSRLPEDGEIDWAQSTRAIYALVRALTPPFPGAFTHLGARQVIIWQARPAPSDRDWAGRVPGRVVGVSDPAGWVDVLTGDGVLRLELVQPHGEDVQPAARAIHSTRTTLGLRPAELLECLRLLLPTVGVP